MTGGTALQVPDTAAARPIMGDLDLSVSAYPGLCVSVCVCVTGETDSRSFRSKDTATLLADNRSKHGFIWLLHAHAIP